MVNSVDAEMDIAGRIKDAMLDYETEEGIVLDANLAKGRPVVHLIYENGEEYAVTIVKIK